jgi:hypothetical protein
VPTPFYHLSIAEELLNNPKLPEETRIFLRRHYPAFLFGNTAPDVQVISGQERRATHFFILPILPSSQPAWEKLLQTYPYLSGQAGFLTPQNAFLAGYLCHLQADWIWITDIFLPIFGPDLSWSTFPQRLYLHNVLRSYLDHKVLPTLPTDTSQQLRHVRPKKWLPFVSDYHLIGWRDYLAQQLEPGATAKTVEVFAARQGISPQDFYDLLDSEEHMNAEVFVHLPREQLQTFRQYLIEANLQLLRSYFNANPIPFSTKPRHSSSASGRI